MNISLNNNTVSLYLDETSVRIMKTRGKRIARIADMAIEEGLSKIDTPEKEAALADKIRQLLKFNKIGDKKIILGLSGLHCLTRPAVLPELPKAMIGEAVAREAKRLLPMPLDQLYLTWQVLSVSGGKTNIFLTAIPRQIADTAIRIINKAGCKPYLMDIKPLALARLSREADVIIIDVQAKEFDIVIMVNGIPQPVRTITFPQEAINLQNKFDIIKEDLKRTLDFVKSKGDQNQIKPGTPIMVSGELADHPELYENLNKELGFKTDKLVSPLKYLKYLEPSQYLVNSGLALKLMTKEAGASLPNFNILPMPYQPRHISMNKMMAVPAAIGAIAILVLLTFSIRDASTNIDQVKTQLDNTNFMLEKKQAQKKELTEKVAALTQEVQAAVTEYDTYMAVLKKITATGERLDNDITTVLYNIPSGITMGGVTFASDVIGLSGTADNKEKVFEFVRTLTATGRFEEITIIGLTAGGIDDSVSYSLCCRFKGARQ
jgi:type IV pilus assembly protein PilM